MRYWTKFTPRNAADAWGDLLSYWRQPTPYRWQILTLSVALTFTLMVLLIPESERAEPRRPDITYITTFEPGRTDAEITASNIANQQRQEEIEAQRKALEERKKELYRRLGRATGVDVDAMEEQIERERAAEEAAAAAQADRAEARAAGAE